MSVTFLYILVRRGETEGVKFCPCSHDGGSECCSVFPPPQPSCVFCCVLVLLCVVPFLVSPLLQPTHVGRRSHGKPPSTLHHPHCGAFLPFFPACTSSSFTQCFFPCCPCLNEQRSSADGKRGRLLFPECGAEALTSLMMFAAVLTWSGTEIGGKIMIVWRSGGCGEGGGMWGGVAALFE